ncbi:MAG: SPFH domain-containing protein, partial [Candidatus Poribacteria bacterium]|nr:SPFH domain-containing protein [Candidatus Poribacteria bacterium]
MRLIVAIAVVIIAAAIGVMLGLQIPGYTNLSTTMQYVAQTAAFILLPVIAFVAAVYRYRKPRADQALVRTGGRQAKISITGGLWLNTIIHEVREIFLDTVRLDIIREGPDALITFDFLRADIEAAFFIRVEPQEDRILRAAQSLGERTMTAEELTELLESKLEGALRTVAAEKELKDLLQKRSEFAEAVQMTIAADLEENGLTLETVSLIRVDQAPLEAMNPNNQFDAQGIKKITEITQSMRRDTERIKLETDVKITEITVNTKSEKLRLNQELAWAEADQMKNIATYSAEREADTLTFQYEQDQRIQEIEYATKLEIERAKIAQEQGVQEREIEKLLGVEMARIAQEQLTQEREIEKNLHVEVAQIDQSRQVQEAEIERMLRVETARLSQEQTVQEREIERDLGVEVAQIAQQEAVQVRDVERTLAIETSRIDQERVVQMRDIEKNLIVETAQIDQTRQVQEAEIERTLRVETAKIAQEQSVKERDIERELGVQVAQLSQQEAVQIRDIERTLATESSRIDQERVVQMR